MRSVARSMIETVGNTPMVRLEKVVPGGSADVVVKLEWFNPTGSYKDRMALAMIEAAEERGDLESGMTVVEYTGGSTGSSLAFVCAAKGYRLRVVSSDAFALEKLRTMAALGAEVTVIPSTGGKVTPDLLPKMIEKVQEYASEPGTYWTNQLRNRDMLAGYRRLGEELLEQLQFPPDVFCAAAGTSGMIMGVAGAFRDAGAGARIVVFEPAESAVISGRPGGAHRVEGVGIGIVPPLLDETLYDEVRAVSESDASEMARRLAAEEGLLTGTSSGLNVAGAIRIAAELGPGHTVATVAVDTGLKYLASDLYG